LGRGENLFCSEFERYTFKLAAFLSFPALGRGKHSFMAEKNFDATALIEVVFV
jgi:hypothetical protein